MGILILLTSILFQFNSYATFSLNTSFAAAFGKDEVVVNLATHSCDQIPFTNDEILSMAVEGVDTLWNRVPTSKLKLRRGSHVTVSGDFATERICVTNSGSCAPNSALAGATEVLISCNDDSGAGAANFPSNNVLAVTLPINTSGKDIVGSVILLNNKVGTGLATLTREEFVAVLAHEIGHAFGLGHASGRDSLMYYTNVPNRKALGYDDIKGISYLYPREQPTSCGSIAYIDDNQRGKGIFSLLLLGTMMFFALKQRTPQLVPVKA
ncbi:hypothetical protein A9Q84_02455 [Halobacteriovorax marinus]|uniref:Peptidase M10 metallopeptidase domain-containing protein n=1 Tax=Halobacteriovorax marinus TaxID=97084 RepID=A0A1Y5FCI8_9BACT|nr:hypothetical protein A9Q84_02455 [Halobacteriovorax marinus]